MADLHVFTNDAEWYVAESLEDALAAQREQTGFTAEDQEPSEWGQLDDDGLLSIRVDEECAEPAVSKTCREWAAEKGRGFLCSTEF